MSTLRSGDRVTIIDIKDATKVLFRDGRLTFPTRGTRFWRRRPEADGALQRDLPGAEGDDEARRGNGEVRRQAIVVLSDGADTASLLSYDDVLDLAKESGIAIYTISLRSKTEVLRASREGHHYFSQSDFGNEGARAGDRSEGLFPVRHLRAGWRLLVDRRRTRKPVRARLNPEEPEEGWRVSPRHRARDGQAGPGPAHAAGTSRRGRANRWSGASRTLRCASYHPDVIAFLAVLLTTGWVVLLVATPVLPGWAGAVATASARSSAISSLSDRFILAGFQLPVCARCLGIYIGVSSRLAYAWMQAAAGRPILAVAASHRAQFLVPRGRDPDTTDGRTRDGREYGTHPTSLAPSRVCLSGLPSGSW